VDYGWWGQNGSVKGYPAIIAGWHWGYHYFQGAAGLPARVYNKPRITTSWHISHSSKVGYETLNTSYDIWLSPIDDPAPSYPGVEVMIWLNHVNQYPIGSPIDTMQAWGHSWAVWRGGMNDGQGHSWDVFSFVCQQNIWQIDSVDIGEFFNYLWAEKNWVDGRRYIIGIEAGNELLQGEGSFTHELYSVSVV
jgi:hypothetical protein